MEGRNGGGAYKTTGTNAVNALSCQQEAFSVNNNAIEKTEII